MDFKGQLTKTAIKGLLDGKASVHLIDFHPRIVESGRTPEHHVAECARISFGNNEFRSIKQDEKLIGYLAKHRHTSPFEMCNATFRIKVPRSIGVHFLRHRTARFNEISQRYCKIEDGEFYIPSESSVGMRLQSEDNKQCSFRSQKNSILIKEMKTAEHLNHLIHLQYNKLLKMGMARESARFYLPQCTYTTFVMNIDLNNLHKLLSLRCAEDAQVETRVIADAIKELATPLFPITMASL